MSIDAFGMMIAVPPASVYWHGLVRLAESVRNSLFRSCSGVCRVGRDECSCRRQEGQVCLGARPGHSATDVRLAV